MAVRRLARKPGGNIRRAVAAFGIPHDRETRRFRRILACAALTVFHGTLRQQSTAYSARKKKSSSIRTTEISLSLPLCLFLALSSARARTRKLISQRKIFTKRAWQTFPPYSGFNSRVSLLSVSQHMACTKTWTLATPRNRSQTFEKLRWHVALVRSGSVERTTVTRLMRAG